MGKVEKYKTIVKAIIGEISHIRTKQRFDLKTQIILDDEHGHYLMYKNGWCGERRIYGCFLHLDIDENGKVWVNHDGTDLLVAQMLQDKGIPKKDIVLGFHAPIMRQDTDFAVA